MSIQSVLKYPKSLFYHHQKHLRNHPLKCPALSAERVHFTQTTALVDMKLTLQSQVCQKQEVQSQSLLYFPSLPSVVQKSLGLKHHQNKTKCPLLWPIPVTGLLCHRFHGHIGSHWSTRCSRLHGFLRACDSAFPVPATNMGIIGVAVECQWVILSEISLYLDNVLVIPSSLASGHFLSPSHWVEPRDQFWPISGQWKCHVSLLVH